MCPTCLEYLNRREGAQKDTATGRWPSMEVLEEARRRHPDAMFGTAEQLLEAASDRAADERIVRASVVWSMEIGGA